MKSKNLLAILMILCTTTVTAQQLSPTAPPKAETTAVRTPPPQAYEDCKGKKAGDAVTHTTREGKVAATCEESSNGLVARPNQPKGARPDSVDAQGSVRAKQ